MSLFVTEFSGQASGRPLGYSGVMTEPPIRTSVMSSGSTAAATLLTLSSGTYFVRLECDVAAYVLFGSSSLATGTQTSTNSERIAANAPGEIRAVRPFMNLIAFST